MYSFIYYILFVGMILYFKHQEEKQYQRFERENRRISSKIDYLIKKLENNQVIESQATEQQPKPVQPNMMGNMVQPQQPVPPNMMGNMVQPQQPVPPNMMGNMAQPQQPVPPNMMRNMGRPQQPMQQNISRKRGREFINNVQTSSQNGIKKVLNSINFENWIGTNVIGLAAAVLIFLGISYLGVLSIPSTNENIKLYGMFAISFVLIGIGYFLNSKRTMLIYTIILGSGIGAFYIAILVTNLYFHKLSDLVTFILLFIWMLFTLVMSKLTNSRELGLIVNIGMIISVTLSFLFGMSEYDLTIIFSYQIISILGCLVTSFILFKKVYVTGIISSLIVILISGVIVSFNIGGGQLYSPEYMVYIVSEFVLINVLTYFLLKEIKNILKENMNKYFYIFTNIIWYLYVFFIGYSFDILKTNIVIIIIALVFLKIILSLLYEKRNLISGKTFETDFFVAAISIAMLHMLFEYKFFFVSAIIFIGLFIITKKEIANKITKVFIILDLLYSFGYYNINETETYAIIIQITYIILMIGFICLAGIVEEHSLNNSKSKIFYYHLPYYYFIIVTIYILNEVKYNEYRCIGIFFIVMFIANGILELINFSKRAEFKIIYHILQKAFILTGLLFIILDPFSDEIAIKWVQIICCVFLLVAIYYNKKIPELRWYKQIFLCIEILLLVYCVVVVIGGVLLYTYVISLVGMFVSVILIILGFLIKAKFIRLFGLSTTLLFILKMVTYDVVEFNSVTKVISFMVGGLICIIISWIYNKLNVKIEK